MAEAGRQCVTLCIACACHQIEAVNLRLASSDLFNMQSGKESGTQSCQEPSHASSIFYGSSGKQTVVIAYAYLPAANVSNYLCTDTAMHAVAYPATDHQPSIATGPILHSHELCAPKR